MDFYSPCSMKKRRYHPKETKSVGKLLSVIVMIYFSTSYNYLSFSTLGNQIKSELKAPIQFCHPVPLYGADPIVNQNSKQPGNDRNLNYYSPDYLFTFLLISFHGCFNLKRELSCFLIAPGFYWSPQNKRLPPNCGKFCYGHGEEPKRCSATKNLRD